MNYPGPLGRPITPQTSITFPHTFTFFFHPTSYLTKGADPFLENAEGLNCFDILASSSLYSGSICGGSGAGRSGCGLWPSQLLLSVLGGGRRSTFQARQRTALVQQLQAAAPFSGLLRLHLKVWGTTVKSCIS